MIPMCEEKDKKDKELRTRHYAGNPMLSQGVILF